MAMQIFLEMRNEPLIFLFLRHDPLSFSVWIFWCSQRTTLSKVVSNFMLFVMKYLPLLYMIRETKARRKSWIIFSYKNREPWIRIKRLLRTFIWHWSVFNDVLVKEITRKTIPWENVFPHFEFQRSLFCLTQNVFFDPRKFDLTFPCRNCF